MSFKKSKYIVLKQLAVRTGNEKRRLCMSFKKSKYIVLKQSWLIVT